MQGQKCPFSIDMVDFKKAIQVVLQTEYLCLHKFHMLKPKYEGTWRWHLWEMLRYVMNYVMNIGSWSDGISVIIDTRQFDPLIKRKEEPTESLSPL